MKLRYGLWLLVLVTIMNVKSAWGLRPGPDNIRECPACQTVLAEGTIMSGNTFGAHYWTDGKLDAPMLPELPWLVKCPKCDVLFWVDESKKLGEQNPWDEDNTWPDVISPNLPTEADFFSQIAPGELSLKKEIYLRCHVWWAANDALRTNQSAIASMPPAQEENLQSLAKLMDENDPDQRITKAEIYRELKKYDDCISLLAKPFDRDGQIQVAAFIKGLAEQKICIVSEVKRGEEVSNPPIIDESAGVVGDLADIKKSIERGADVNARDAGGRTPLMQACFNGRLDVVEFLVEKGADVNARDEYGQTPLREAVLCGHLDIVEFLVKRGADVNLPDDSGATPLMFAKGDIAQLLVANGADVNARRNDGQTPLMIAVADGQLETVGFLLDNGADANTTNHFGDCVLRFASKDTADMLKRHGAKSPGGSFDYPDGLDYRTADGDTIELVASLFVVTPEGIRSVNHIPPGGQVPIGTLLRIPPPE